jgi:hypothetical protein
MMHHYAAEVAVHKSVPLPAHAIKRSEYDRFCCCLQVCEVFSEQCTANAGIHLLKPAKENT